MRMSQLFGQTVCEAPAEAQVASHNLLVQAGFICILIIGSREALRERLGAPAALGLPCVRGERGA